MRSFIREISKNRLLYMMGIPGFICLAVFSYTPMIGHLLAFKRYTFQGGFLFSPWVGWDNFRFFFTGNNWKQLTFNTMYLNALFILFTHVTAIVLSIFINEIRKTATKRLVQSAIFFPYFVSWLVVSLMLITFLNKSDGMVNNTMVQFGFERHAFYQNADIWPAILTGSYVWKFAGYYSVIYIATIIGIPIEYYESASIDGANKWQQMFRITLPLIAPTFTILTLLAVGRIFYGDFGMIYGIIGENGLLYRKTDVIDTYTYRALKNLNNFGMASAVSLYQSLMGLVIIVVFNRIIHRISPESALF